jgi:hypothetical protein
MGEPTARTGDEAAALIARMANNQLGVAVSPEAMKEFFIKNWRQLSGLAHAIHKEVAPEEYRPRYDRTEIERLHYGNR